jgi:hypothetical protein
MASPVIGGHRPVPQIWQGARPGGGGRTGVVQGVELGQQRIVVFAGHGGWTASDGSFFVPGGMTITFLVKHGVALGNNLGMKIDSRQGLYDLLDDVNQKDPTLPRVYQAGDSVYNYRLYHWDKLTLGNTSADLKFVTVPASNKGGILLSDLIKLPECANANMFWSACCSI